MDLFKECNPSSEAGVGPAYPAVKQLLAVRRCLRGQFQTAMNVFQRAESGNVESSFAKLQDKAKRLFSLDDTVLTAAAWTDEQIVNMCEEAETFRDAFLEAESRFKSTKLNTDGEVNIEKNPKKTFQLPKINFKKFDGQPENWLPFWNQFKRIDESKLVERADKLQYLIQGCTGKALKLVDSFPQKEDNYCLILSSLKARFAKESTLIRYYVRQILNLVTNPRNSSNLSIETLYNTLEGNLRALETLEVTRDKYCHLLSPLVEAALPDELLIAWQRQRHLILPGKAALADGTAADDGESTISSDNELDALLKFLGQEVENLERLQEVREAFNDKKNVKNFETSDSDGEKQPTAAALLKVDYKESGVKLNLCVFCDKSHYSHNCRTARNLPLDERKKLLANKRACWLCLKVGHRISTCLTGDRCLVCYGKHATIICEKLGPTKEKEDVQASKVTKTLTNYCGVKRKSYYPPTFLVKLAHKGELLTVRGLIDSGCQRSYILEDVAQKLKLEPIGYEVLANSLFGGKVMPPKKRALFEVEVRDISEKFSLTVEVLGEAVICNHVPMLHRLDVAEFPGIHFTDSADQQASPIVLVLGSDVFGQILTGKIVRAKTGGLTAIETTLGWTLTGKNECSTSLVNICLQNIEMTQLWDLDVLGIRDPIEVRTAKEKELDTLAHFEKSIARLEDKRFEVALPWLCDHPPLPTYFHMARKRLNAVSKRLLQKSLFREYQEIFTEWEEAGVIEEVSDLDRGKHYLAHRPVLKLHLGEEKFRIRPVFDGSAHYGEHPSLNDCLSSGPNLLETITPLIVKFRLGQYGVTADIKKAFLQISLKPEDRDYLRFLWWADGEKMTQLKIYQHCRVVFGIRSSPFLLNATLAYYFDKEKFSATEKNVVQKLKSSFYMDDCVTSLDSLSELNQFINTAKRIMAEAKFDLRGWVYSGSQTCAGAKTLSVLGMMWNVETDTLFCQVKIEEALLTESISKRKLLSIANGAFDTIGFTCAVMLIPKILMQETWARSVGWDEELPSDISERFKAWYSQLHLLNNCQIPRWLFKSPVIWSQCSLHFFCDSSGAAYATCAFLRHESETGITLQLVLAKARVAPKNATIPRLELLSACLSARLYHVIKGSIEQPVTTYFWSDSQVALAWIRSDGERWKLFVQNRVKEIRALTDVAAWRHVPGTMNAADFPSRGGDAKVLLEKKWWEGPEWLKQSPENWPKEERSSVDVSEDLTKERKKVTTVCMILNEENADNDFLEKNIGKFESYTKNIRVVAWIRRFCYNSQNSNHKVRGEITGDEFLAAETAVLKVLQLRYFTRNVEKEYGGFPTFKDNNGIIYIKSRLVNEENENCFQHPILIFDNFMTHKLIQEKHVALNHAGTTTVLSCLRENFFLLKGRRLVNKIISKCRICMRHNSKAMTVPMPPLPSDRTRTASTFQVSGVDLMGPLFLRDGAKVWVTLFTCAVYRCVHLELVESLSAESFILALRRFISRRGRISVIYSDNGSNFRKSDSLLRQLDWNEILKDSSVARISWKFNVAAAPWRGGWWERLVGVVKRLLKKTLGRAHLSYIELESVLCDVEGTINSRPLTYLSDNPKELMPLTPAHFLRDLPGNEVPDLDSIDRDFLTKRMKYLQTVRQHLRSRFRQEYLSQLLLRRQHIQYVSGEVKVGDVVLVEDPNKKRVSWPLGLITETIPGRDGLIRTVKVKVREGIISRPVQRIFPLELSGEDNTESVSIETSALDREDQEAITSVLDREDERDREAVSRSDIVDTLVSRAGRVIRPPLKLDL